MPRAAAAAGSNGWRNDNRYNWRGYRNQNRNAFHLPRYYAPRGYGYGYQRFSIGLTIGSLLFAPQYWIDDPWSYRLPDAYGPYRWVRYFNDALLVDIDTGEVVDVEYDIFW
ncbi:MAG: RcnB family protein [Sphingomonas sp.]